MKSSKGIVEKEG